MSSPTDGGMDGRDPDVRPAHVTRRSFLVRSAGFAALPLLAACAPLSSTQPTPAPAAPKPASGPTVAAGSQPAAATSKPRAGGVLRAATVGEYVNIDGHYYSPKAGLATWIIYDTLTRYDDDLKVQPMLAESWEQSSDARQLTLKLRKGVTFHNGREFTSDDVLYNFNRVTDAKITAGIITNFIPPETTWEAPDKYTVVVKSKNPWPAIFDWLEVVGILDKETMEGPDSKTKAVGTGPFTFMEWVPGRPSHLRQEQELLADRPAVSGRDPREHPARPAVDGRRSSRPARSIWR